MKSHYIVEPPAELNVVRATSCFVNLTRENLQLSYGSLLVWCPVNFGELGIVVIGRNEGQRLIDSLASLSAVEARIVYVDSGSSDNSVVTAERMGIRVVNLDVTRPFTAARARNEGFAAITTQDPDIRFVQFIDGDCQLAPDWLTNALAFAADKKNVAVVCGRRRERHPEQSIYNRLCDIEWNSQVGEALACGGDSLVRVAAFTDVDGFRTELIAGEEPEFCARLRSHGWEIWRLDAEMTRHDAAIFRFSQWWLRAVRSGYAEAEILCLPSPGVQTTERRDVFRAVGWAGLVPLALGLGTLFHPAVLFGILIYPLQIGRIAIRRGFSARESWLYGLFVLIAKFAQLQGILRYLWRRWRKAQTRLIEYKHPK